MNTDVLKVKTGAYNFAFLLDNGEVKIVEPEIESGGGPVHPDHDAIKSILKEMVEDIQVKQAVNSNPMVRDIKETFEKCLSVVIAKNKDYSGEANVDNDPFKNMKGSQFVGVDVERGALVRMMDKMGRISSLIGQKANVKDEAIEDTLDDLINYAAILKSYLKRNKRTSY
jgi:hypothetical protein